MFELSYLHINHTEWQQNAIRDLPANYINVNSKLLVYCRGGEAKIESKEIKASEMKKEEKVAEYAIELQIKGQDNTLLINGEKLHGNPRLKPYKARYEHEREMTAQEHKHETKKLLTSVK